MKPTRKSKNQAPPERVGCTRPCFCCRPCRRFLPRRSSDLQLNIFQFCHFGQSNRNETLVCRNHRPEKSWRAGETGPSFQSFGVFGPLKKERGKMAHQSKVWAKMSPNKKFWGKMDQCFKFGGTNAISPDVSVAFSASWLFVHALRSRSFCQHFPHSPV